MTAQPIETPRERIERRLTAIARAHGLTVPQMKSKSRFREFVAARREAYRYLHEEEGWSTPQIGRYFGRDHSTVLWAIDHSGRVERTKDEKRAYAREYAARRRLINPWPEKRRERLEANVTEPLTTGANNKRHGGVDNGSRVAPCAVKTGSTTNTG